MRKRDYCQCVCKNKSPPVAAHEVVEDAPDKNPDEVENGSGEQRGEDLLADEGALVGLEAQDDDAADVGAEKISEVWSKESSHSIPENANDVKEKPGNQKVGFAFSQPLEHPSKFNQKWCNQTWILKSWNSNLFLTYHPQLTVYNVDHATILDRGINIKQYL